MCVCSHQDCAIKIKRVNMNNQIGKIIYINVYINMHDLNIKQYKYAWQKKKIKNNKKNNQNNCDNYNTMRVYGCVFCSVPVLLVYLRMSISSNASSIAGVPFDSVGSLRTTSLLRTNCMRSCCNWSASCVVALQTKNQKPNSNYESVKDQTLVKSNLLRYKSHNTISISKQFMRNNVRQHMWHNCHKY